MLRDNLKFIWLVFSVIFLVIGCTSPQSKIADESGKRDSIKTEVVKSITDSVKLDCTAYKQLAFKSDSIL
jgi:hypothetical protein